MPMPRTVRGSLKLGIDWQPFENAHNRLLSRCCVWFLLHHHIGPTLPPDPVHVLTTAFAGEPDLKSDRVHILLKIFRGRAGNFRIVENQPDLVVDMQRALIKIEGSDEHDFSIEYHGFGMQAGLLESGQPGERLAFPIL